ncbi:MAG: zinc ribbon domain-containing protein YjdM [Gammaproteobacteria bacterium]
MIPACPKCACEYAYEDRDNYVCPECGHEWSRADVADSQYEVKDVNGNVLVSGDTVFVVKNLKVKGASSDIKVGTKVKNIRVLDADHVVDGHDIDCKIEGFGAMKLKGSVVKKVG